MLGCQRDQRGGCKTCKTPTCCLEMVFGQKWLQAPLAFAVQQTSQAFKRPLCLWSGEAPNCLGRWGEAVTEKQMSLSNLLHCPRWIHPPLLRCSPSSCQHLPQKVPDPSGGCAERDGERTQGRGCGARASLHLSAPAPAAQHTLPQSQAAPGRAEQGTGFCTGLLF